MTLRPQYSEPAFAGADYIPARDDKRLLTQLEKIRAFMSDGQWHTLKEIEQATGAPQSSASAQLRHLTEPQHGAHIKEKVYCGDGLYRYRITGGHPVQLKLRRQ